MSVLCAAEAIWGNLSARKTSGGPWLDPDPTVEAHTLFIGTSNWWGRFCVHSSRISCPAFCLTGLEFFGP